MNADAFVEVFIAALGEATAGPSTTALTRVVSNKLFANPMPDVLRIARRREGNLLLGCGSDSGSFGELML
jgi:hypothetical protein